MFGHFQRNCLSINKKKTEYKNGKEPNVKVIEFKDSSSTMVKAW
jgi:hypothetical protein